VEALGWVGFTASIAGYLGFTSRRISLRAFHAFNLLAGACMAANSYSHGAWPAAVLAVAWAAIAARGLANGKLG
jgi:hypothetical protein